MLRNYTVQLVRCWVCLSKVQFLALIIKEMEDYRLAVAEKVTTFIDITKHTTVVKELGAQLSICDGKLSTMKKIIEDVTADRKIGDGFFCITVRTAIGHGELYEKLISLAEKIEKAEDLETIEVKMPRHDR